MVKQLCLSQYRWQVLQRNFLISYVKILVQEQTVLGNAVSQKHVDKGDCGISLELLKCILIHIYLTCQ